MTRFLTSMRTRRSDHQIVFGEFAMRLMAVLVALHVGPVARLPPFKVYPGAQGAMSPRPSSPRCATKFTPAHLEQVEADGTFSGYASLFGEADLGRDVVMPGAFAASPRRRGAAGVKMLFQHDPAEPIGVWHEIREDSRGLFVRGRLTPEVARAREVLALMRAGALDGLSIGYRTLRARADPKAGVRRLLEVDLWEISIVTFPMLSGARVSDVKAQHGERRIAAALRRAAELMRPTIKETKTWM